MNVTLTILRVSLLAAAIIAAGCASNPRVNSEVAMLQSQLRDMQSDPRIASHAAAELREAEQAVQVLVDGRRMRQADFDQNLYLANRLVYIAGAEGLARHAAQEGQQLDRERETMLVEARTREADNARRMAAYERARANDAEQASRRARGDAERAQRDAEQARLQTEHDRVAAGHDQRAANLARSDADSARSEANIARSEADTARSDAGMARSDAERARSLAKLGQRDAELARADAVAARAGAESARRELKLMQTELADLNARQTERGLVVTVGDVLFEVDRAELRGGGQRELDRLAGALRDRTEFNLVIEGHTDSTGSAAHNQDLSERRADSVRRYLIAGGISSDRTTSTGLGQHHPVASNDNEGGRQQNRRVEIVIQQQPEARISAVDPG